MTGRTERQYRRRAHYPARINLGITNELRDDRAAAAGHTLMSRRFNVSDARLSTPVDRPSPHNT